MKKTITSIDRADQREKHITAFSAVKQEYGLKIEAVGCVEESWKGNEFSVFTRVKPLKIKIFLSGFCRGFHE